MTTNTSAIQTPRFKNGTSTNQQSVKINLPSILKNITIAGFIYTLGFLLLSLLSASDFLDEQFALIGLHLVAALSLYSYWRLEPWGSAKYDSFGAAILLITISFNLLNALDTFIYGTYFDKWPKTIMVNSSLIYLYFKGESINFFGMLLMVAAWRLTVRDKMQHLTFLRSANVSNNLNFKILYGLVVLSQVFIRLLNIDFGSIAQLFSIIYSAGVASIYFLSRSNHKSKRFYPFLKAILLGLPLSFLALNVGMKIFIITPLVPAAIIIWLTYSSVIARFGLVIISISLLSITQIYAGYVRQTSWTETNRTYSTNELIAGAFNSSDDDSIMEGFESMLGRMNLTSSHAITIALAERDGFIPVAIFGGIPTGFVPRILWPDKPILNPGNLHTQRINDFSQDIGDITSGTAAGFFPELYLGGGILGLILFSVLYGFILGRIQLSIFRQLSLSASVVFSYMMFFSAIRFDEATIAYAMTGIVLTYILIFFIFKVLALMFLEGRQ